MQEPTTDNASSPAQATAAAETTATTLSTAIGPAAEPAEPNDPAGTAAPAEIAQGAAPAEAAADAGPAAAASSAAASPVAELSPQQCAAALAERFPALFALQQPLPLKLRIQADIQARAPGVFTRKSLSIFLHRYTTGTPYLKALAQQPHRHDLDGQPAGDVAAEHREAATAELERRRALLQARRAAERGGKPGPGRAVARATGTPPGTAVGGTVDGTASGTANATADGAAAAGADARRETRPPRPPRGPRPAGAAGAGGPAGQTRGPQPAGRPGPHSDGPRRERRDASRAAPPAQARPPRPPRPPHGGELSPQHQPPVTDAESQQRRERAQLLRAFEASPLSPANFAALKGMTPAELERQVEQARREAANRSR